MPTQVTIHKKDVPQNSQVCLLELQGEIDESNLNQLQEAIEPLLEDSNVLFIIFNLKNLAYVNSKVIGYLASFYSKLSPVNKKMIFAEANPNIMDILSLVGLTNIVDYYDTENEAINACIG